MLETAGLNPRPYERWDVDNAAVMEAFVKQKAVIKLSEGLVNGMREDEATVSFVHECMASAVPGFSGVTPMHKEVSPGCEAISRTNVRLTLVFYNIPSNGQ